MRCCAAKRTVWPTPGRTARRPLGAVEELEPALGEGGALDQLGLAAAALAGHEAFETYRERLAAVAVEVSDVARSLRDEVEAWEDDPARLAGVQERRRLLGELRRKYGSDLVAVMAYGAEGAGPAGRARRRRGRGGPAAGRARRRAGELAEAESAVRTVRARAAGAFGDAVGERLGALAMPGARVEVAVAPTGTGEPVELLLGANVGEPVQPLARAASGGELARAMLAIRLVGLGGPQTHGLRRGRRRAWVAPPRWPSGTRCTRWRAGARCWWSPTWPRWPRRPTHTYAWSSGDVEGPHRHERNRGGGRGTRDRALAHALGAPGQRRRPRHARELLGTTGRG